MAVQMLPGWWDQIAPSAMGFVENLQRAVAPNFYANQRLQQMAQKDPTIMATIANLGREEQDALAQAMGFRGQNPFGSLPVGMERQEAMTQQDLRNKGRALDPEGAAVGAVPGARTRTQQALDALKPKMAEQTMLKADIDIDSAILGNEAAEIVLNERKRALAQLEELRARTPGFDPIGLVQRAFAGRLSAEDNDALQRLGSDPDFAGAFDVLKSTEIFRRQNMMNFSLRSAGDQADMIKARNDFIIKSVEGARREYDSAVGAIEDVFKSNALSGMSREKAMARDPMLRQAVEAARTRMKNAESVYNMYRPKAAAVMGVEIPELMKYDMNAGGATLSPKIQSAVDRIRSGKATIEQLQSSSVFTPEEKALIAAQIQRQP